MGDCCAYPEFLRTCLEMFLVLMLLSSNIDLFLDIGC